MSVRTALYFTADGLVVAATDIPEGSDFVPEVRIGGRVLGVVVVDSQDDQDAAKRTARLVDAGLRVEDGKLQERGALQQAKVIEVRMPPRESADRKRAPGITPRLTSRSE